MEITAFSFGVSDRCSSPLLCKYWPLLRQCFQLLTRVDAICYDGSAEDQDYHFKGGHYSKWLSPKSSRSKGFLYLEKKRSNNKSHLLSPESDLWQSRVYFDPAGSIKSASSFIGKIGSISDPQTLKRTTLSHTVFPIYIFLEC